MHSEKYEAAGPRLILICSTQSPTTTALTDLVREWVMESREWRMLHPASYSAPHEYPLILPKDSNSPQHVAFSDAPDWITAARDRRWSRARCSPRRRTSARCTPSS